jgi:hypothetical protein
LASYYIAAARTLEGDDKFTYGNDSSLAPRTRDELFKEATALVTLAEDIDDQDIILLTNKGIALTDILTIENEAKLFEQLIFTWRMGNTIKLLIS